MTPRHENLTPFNYNTEALEHRLAATCNGYLPIWHRLELRRLATSLGMMRKSKGRAKQKNTTGPFKALTNLKANLQRRKRTSDASISSKLIEVPEPARVLLPERHRLHISRRNR